MNETYKVEGVCGGGDEREGSRRKKDKACGREVREDAQTGRYVV